MGIKAVEHLEPQLSQRSKIQFEHKQRLNTMDQGKNTNQGEQLRNSSSRMPRRSQGNPPVIARHIPIVSGQSSNVQSPGNPPVTSSKSIIMARIQQRELLKQTTSTKDLFEPLVTMGGNEGKNPTSSTSTRDDLPFTPRTFGLTRNVLDDSFARGSSGFTDDLDSFEDTIDEFHTTNDIVISTPTNKPKLNEYHASPSYSLRNNAHNAGRSHTAGSARTEGLQVNPKRPFGGSSTISFTNTAPYNGATALAIGQNLPRTPKDKHPFMPKKGKVSKAKMEPFSPTSTAISTMSDKEFYSGLSDMQMGFYMSTYSAADPANMPKPMVLKKDQFPDELPPRRSIPLRVSAATHARYRARKEDQRLEEERRLAVPHLVQRAPPECNWWTLNEAFFRRITCGGRCLLLTAQFGLLSLVACISVIATARRVGVDSPYRMISVPIIWWLSLTLITLGVVIAASLTMYVRGNARRIRLGFRQPLGIQRSNHGMNRRLGDLESGISGQNTFELVPGARLPHRANLVGGLNTYGPPAHHLGNENIYTEGFQHRLGDLPEENDAFQSLESPVTPLTPLPQAVLSPIVPRYAPGFYENPTSTPTKTSTRSHDSIMEAAAHRNKALRTLLGEEEPEQTLDRTDTYNANRESSETLSMYKGSPSVLDSTIDMDIALAPLKRGEIGGRLERYTHQSYQVGESSTANQIFAERYESPIGSRNPYRDSMNEHNALHDNFETLPATYYVGKGKGRAQ